MPSANLVVAKAQLQLSEPTKADVNDIFQSIFRLPKAQRRAQSKNQPKKNFNIWLADIHSGANPVSASPTVTV